MDILIKGMEMPKNCRSCPLIYETNREFTCWQIMKKWPIEEAEHRQEGCPLVALPEHHGRLIDADAFIENHKNGFRKNWDVNGETIGTVNTPLQPVKKALDEAPTILEATE